MYISKKFIIFLVISLVIGVLIIVFNKDINKICFENNCFVVEVVDTFDERERGLMFREELDKNKGMLFIFENNGNYPFWMKNTLIPLDIIWIDESGNVVDIKEAFPCTSDPCPIIYHVGTARYVLEINGGLASKFEIRVGDKAVSSLIKYE